MSTKRFGTLSDEILGLVVKDWDDQEKTLAQMIGEATSEHILNSRYLVETTEEGEPYLTSFTGWTENYVLVLVCSSLGYFMLKEDRNF